MADTAALRRAISDVRVFSKAICGAELWDHQVAVANSRARYRVICSGRQAGKSRFLAISALHKAFTSPGSLTLIVSAGEIAAQRVLADIGDLCSRPLLRGSVVDETKSRVVLSNGSEILSVPASMRQIRGWAVDLRPGQRLRHLRRAHRGQPDRRQRPEGRDVHLAAHLDRRRRPRLRRLHLLGHRQRLHVPRHPLRLRHPRRRQAHRRAEHRVPQVIRRPLRDQLVQDALSLGSDPRRAVGPVRDRHVIARLKRRPQRMLARPALTAPPAPATGHDHPRMILTGSENGSHGYGGYGQPAESGQGGAG